MPTSSRRSSWGIVLSSVLRRPYPEAPVSSLFLLGRQQAFAYQQEVDGNASQRHHVRFWPVPDGWTLPGGFQVGWLAAATYDKAVGISLFTLQVTHRVDADIDIERDYVLDTVRYVAPEAFLRVIKEYSSAFTTRNGGGDVVRTDGSLPILDVTGLRTAEPDLVEPATDALSRAVSPRVPPPTLLAAGVMSMAKAAITLTAVLEAIFRGDGSPAPASTLELAVMGGGALCLLGLWVFMLAHHAWARIALMVVCTVEAITHLLALSSDAEVTFLVLMNAAVTVLILIAVSSNGARRWVRLGRRGRVGAGAPDDGQPA